MLLDFLRPKMNVNNDEVFSVYPGKTNQPGDLIKGRTFRRLNVTRKIVIGDVPSLLTTALDMQTFALGKRCIKQRRGSPMGSPLSPAMCLMVVSISEEIWFHNFQEILSNHHLFVRHIRYVDNRLLLGDPRLVDLPPYETLLDDGFYGPFTVFGIPSKSSSQWLPLALPHRGQRSCYTLTPIQLWPKLPFFAFVPIVVVFPPLALYGSSKSHGSPPRTSTDAPKYMAGCMPWFSPPRDYGYESEPEYSGGHHHRRLTRFVPRPKPVPVPGEASSSSVPARPDLPTATLTLSHALERPSSSSYSYHPAVTFYREEPPPTTVSGPRSMSTATTPVATWQIFSSTGNPASLPLAAHEPHHSSSGHAANPNSDSQECDRALEGPPPSAATLVEVATHPAPPKASGPPPEIVDHKFRGWAHIDDNELIQYKQDTRARFSWKAIGQRLHRDPDSCKARWKWLLSQRPEPRSGANVEPAGDD
eukprot:s2567_g2.t1